MQPVQRAVLLERELSECIVFASGLQIAKRRLKHTTQQRIPSNSCRTNDRGQQKRTDSQRTVSNGLGNNGPANFPGGEHTGSLDLIPFLLQEWISTTANKS